MGKVFGNNEIKQSVRFSWHLLLLLMLYSAQLLSVVIVMEQAEFDALEQIKSHLNGGGGVEKKVYQDQVKKMLKYCIANRKKDIRTEEVKKFIDKIEGLINASDFDPEGLKSRIDGFLMGVSEFCDDTVRCNECSQTRKSDWFKKYLCDHDVCLECSVKSDDSCPVCIGKSIDGFHGAAGGYDLFQSELTQCPSCGDLFIYEGQGFVKCFSCGEDICVNCGVVVHKDKSCADYYSSLDGVDKKKLAIRRCGKKKPVEDEKVQKKSCVVCFEECDYQWMADLTCAHDICIDCLEKYIGTAENLETVDGRLQLICPEPNCKQHIPDAIFNFLYSPKKMDKKSLDDYVIHGGGKYCPGGCETLITTEDVSLYDGKAFYCHICKKNFCLSCGEKGYHDGLTCEENKVFSDDKKMLRQIKDLKDCPNCRSPIIKKGGCNHIKCTCGYSFCFKCLQRWGGYMLDGRGMIGRNCGCDIYLQ